MKVDFSNFINRHIRIILMAKVKQSCLVGREVADANAGQGVTCSIARSGINFFKLFGFSAL